MAEAASPPGGFSSARRVPVETALHMGPFPHGIALWDVLLVFCVSCCAIAGLWVGRS